MLRQHWPDDDRTVMRQQPGLDQREVAISPLGLIGDLVVPKTPRGIILFAHGSGSSRHRPRNKLVFWFISRGTLIT